MPLRNLIIVAVAVVVSFACYSVASKNHYANLFAEAMELVDTQALRIVPRERLFTSAMNGMLDELDEHSMFISGEDFKAFDEDMRQEFAGVGMYIENNPLNDRLFIMAPMPGTPAFEAGLQVGDEIVLIDGVDSTVMKRGDAVKLLRGPVNEPVDIVVNREGEKIERRLVRAAIPLPSVFGDYRNADGSWQFQLEDHPRVGYLRLLQFGEKSADEMKAALTELNGKVDGLILDLRNNSGGLLTVAVEICDFFLKPDSAIVSIRGRDQVVLDESRSEFPSLVKTDLPIVILINRNSASASEIVAGCLQDHDRAVVIGEQSWGKGTVQNVIPMQRDESALKLTTASYWRPSGREIDRYTDAARETKIWGIQPNQGFAIEMYEEEVFNNMRFRSMRDIEGLMPNGPTEAINAIKNIRIRTDENGNLEEDNGDSDDETDGTPGPDDETDGNGNQPHVDRPLQRAIEYFKTVLNERRIAA